MIEKILISFLAALWLCAGFGCLADELEPLNWESDVTRTKVDQKILQVNGVVPQGPFHSDWKSLGNHQVPDWYRDAKFGIFIHWGLYSVPAYANEWYSRNMYQQGEDAFKHHLATYGPQDKFGYKDFIPLFKAEKFDPAHWAKVFKEAGAKYVVPVAEHHDGFAMYDSDFSDWTSLKMGPHRDVIGELAHAVRAEGLVFGLSSHRAEHWWFMNGGRKFKSDVQDPRYAEFYGPAAEDDSAPSEEWTRNWLARSAELVDKYHPQLVYFDWWIGEKAVFKPYLEKFTAYYYDRAAEWKEGVVLNTKDKAFVPGTAVQDVEKGKPPGINPVPWQTDTSVSWKSWAYLKDDQLKDAGYLIRTLIDTVSRNGNLLLDIGPKPDGTIPGEQEKILLQIGDWLKVNGEAIYGTRPWITYGEGPTQEAGGKFSESDVKYQEGDVRFTRKRDILYILCLAPPTKPLVLQSLGKDQVPGITIQAVTALSGRGTVKWDQGPQNLTISADRFSGPLPVVFKAVLSGSAWGDFSLGTGPKGFTARAVYQNYDGSQATLKATLLVDGKKASSKTLRAESQGGLAFEIPCRISRAGVYKVSLSALGQPELSGQAALPFMDLSGKWLFHAGDDPSWSKLDLEDAGWDKVNLPAYWSAHGHKYEKCFGWYRKHVIIPKEWAGHSLVIPLGKIDDVDISYLNGQEIGRMGSLPPDYNTAWNQERRYEVPAELVRFGEENVIAIRVYDGPGDAGLHEGPLGPVEVK